jgi:hypothetical protein
MVPKWIQFFMVADTGIGVKTDFADSHFAGFLITVNFRERGGRPSRGRRSTFHRIEPLD